MSAESGVKYKFVVLSLGSNIEPRDYYINYAINNISLHDKKISKMHETEPLLPEKSMELDSSWYEKFVNCVLCGFTEQNLESFFSLCCSIEKNCQRVRKYKFAPRTLDIDILFWNNQIIDSAYLTIPHYDLHNRKFVIEPLMEILPDYVHPKLNKTIRQIYEDLI
ncbi:2-amino-4-hydroxy-6-hydroxymethyldihydropteridine diphosphokinase [Anaplasmataceae bacterium AB001_6]|nr:2-amino-4-hydroxy-6-hydroxymethyldihydropteridine diphosphokinase [Anaplasmataceae bacterium AB001_6]